MSLFADINILGDILNGKNIVENVKEQHLQYIEHNGTSMTSRHLLNLFQLNYLIYLRRQNDNMGNLPDESLRVMAYIFPYYLIINQDTRQNVEDILDFSIVSIADKFRQYSDLYEGIPLMSNIIDLLNSSRRFMINEYPYQQNRSLSYSIMLRRVLETKLMTDVRMLQSFPMNLIREYLLVVLMELI